MSLHDKRVEQVVIQHHRQAQPFHDWRERIQHHHPRSQGAEHLRLKKHRRKEDSEREQHLDKVFHVPEEEIRAADEERQPGRQQEREQRERGGPQGRDAVMDVEQSKRDNNVRMPMDASNACASVEASGSTSRGK